MVGLLIGPKLSPATVGPFVENENGLVDIEENITHCENVFRYLV
jgi:hypothetical protein